MEEEKKTISKLPSYLSKAIKNYQHRNREKIAEKARIRYHQKKQEKKDKQENKQETTQPTIDELINNFKNSNNCI